MARQPQGMAGGGSARTGTQASGKTTGDQIGGQIGGQTGGQMGQTSRMGQTGGQTGQMGRTGGPMGQQGGRGMTIDQALTPEMRTALYGFVEAAKVCDWCAEQCLDEGPGMAQCVRMCRDVVDLAELNFKFLARDSVFGSEVATTFVEAATECAQECSRHSHPHCQECARVLDQSVQSVNEMLNSFAGGGGQGIQQGQFGSQQGQVGQGSRIPQTTVPQQ